MNWNQKCKLGVFDRITDNIYLKYIFANISLMYNYQKFKLSSVV